MSECRKTLDRLTPYLDAELPPADAEGMTRHLGACPPCRREAEAQRTARSILRQRANALREAPLPPGLLGRCEALARAESSAAAVPFWRGQFVTALLTAVVLIFGGSAVFSLATERSDTLLAAQLTADHVKCFRVIGPEEPQGADARSIERTLAEEYGWPVRVAPTSAEHGVTLVGARRCLYADGLVPHVMYRVRGHDVSLFVLPGHMRHAADVGTLGHQSHIWSQGDATYVLVSTASAGELSAVERYIMDSH